MVHLPFPKVAAITAFVSRQLHSEECRLSEAELARNASRPGLLLCAAAHPLAARLRMCSGGGAAADAAAAASADPAATAAEEEEQAGAGPASAGEEAGSSGTSEAEAAGGGTSSNEEAEAAGSRLRPDAVASMLPLLLPPPVDAAAGGDASQSFVELPPGLEGVVAAALDIAGQHTPPFAPGLLPGGQGAGGGGLGSSNAAIDRGGAP